MKSLSRVWFFATPWTVAYPVPPSMGFLRQESWSGLPFPSPGDLPNSGIEPGSPTFQADALTSEPPGKPNFKKKKKKTHQVNYECENISPASLRGKLPALHSRALLLQQSILQPKYF